MFTKWGDFMKNKNEFAERYTQTPDKKGTRKFVRAIVLFANIYNYLILYSYYEGVLNLSIPKTSLFTFVQIIVIFDLCSLLLYIFPDELNKLTGLYGAITFTVSSIMYFFISCKVFLYELNDDAAHLIIGISLLLYIIIMAAVIINIKNKFKSNYNRKSANKTLGAIIIALCISIGIILSKQTKLNCSYFALALLISAYCTEPAISGFHKFYLLIKGKE